MTWIENIILYWKEVAILASPLIGWFLGRKSRATKDKTDEVNLASTTLDVYNKMYTTLSNRIDDLQNKYDEILLKNAILVERADSYESKYKILEKDYIKLKSDHDKLHKENREIRKELEEIKNGNI